MNISDKMKELVVMLRKHGINDVKMPDIKPECEEDWSESYAIVQNVYADPEYDFYKDAASEYQYDVEQFVKNFFAGAKVVFYWKSGEIEVSK